MRPQRLHFRDVQRSDRGMICIDRRLYLVGIGLLRVAGGVPHQQKQNSEQQWTTVWHG